MVSQIEKNELTKLQAKEVKREKLGLNPQSKKRKYKPSDTDAI